jgi:hypothetical protein
LKLSAKPLCCSAAPGASRWSVSSRPPRYEILLSLYCGLGALCLPSGTRQKLKNDRLASEILPFGAELALRRLSGDATQSRLSSGCIRRRPPFVSRTLTRNRNGEPAFSSGLAPHVRLYQFVKARARGAAYGGWRNHSAAQL